MVGGEWTAPLHFEGAGSERLGAMVSGGVDFDGDGVLDFLLGAPADAAGGPPTAGSVQVRSGATGALLWSLVGSPGDGIGRSAALADVDADGFFDLIVGASSAAPSGKAGAGQVLIYSGTTGALLWQFDGAEAGDCLGWAVVAAGDVDGDGFADLAVGAPFASPGSLLESGSVSLYSGATGSLLWAVHGDAAGDHLGFALSAVGDADGDGSPEVLAGAPGAAPGGLVGAGAVRVISGLTGSDLRRFAGSELGGQLGWSVTRCGDVQRDGVEDYLLGAPGASPGGLAAAGRATLYSGANGNPMRSFPGDTPGGRFGSSVSIVGDVDGDGRTDVIAGAPAAIVAGLPGAGYAAICSGATGEQLKRFSGEFPDQELGAAVSWVGDLDSDRIPEFVIGAPGTAVAGAADAGAATLHSLDPFLVPADWKLSATNGLPTRLEIDFPPTEAGKGYILLCSLKGVGLTQQGGIDIPLIEDGNLLRLINGWRPPLIANGRGRLDANGDGWSLFFGHHMLVRILGKRIYLAAVSFDRDTRLGRLSSSARSLRVVF